MIIRLKSNESKKGCEMKESATVEFKATFSKTFLKTVSAFANYDGGEILFGIDDDGNIVGIDDPEELCSRIENSINDALEPLPTYSLEQETRKGKEIVRLEVLRGHDTPYCASGKAYKRSHTSTVVVDATELKRLVMRGLNLSFEECPATNQALTFDALNEALKRELGIDDVDDKVYRTLELYAPDHGFNNAAAVFADKNEFPGIDIVKFGKTISEFMDRSRVDHVSVLRLYDEALAMFDRHYGYETITGFTRKKKYMVPEVAYREAIANALVHRVWDIPAMVQVSFFDDRIEVVSPGALPDGVSEEDYLAGRLSVLRNPIIAGVFARLGYIERFGTGILRIKAAYEGSGLQPQFRVSGSTITIILPTLATIEALDGAERKVLALLEKHGSLKRSEIEENLGASKSKVTRILKQLNDKKLIKIEGTGRGTKYKL